MLKMNNNNRIDDDKEDLLIPSTEQCTTSKWSVVHFIATNEVNLVPSSWIYEDEHLQLHCYWPADKDISTKIKRSTPPDREWPAFEIRIMKEYDSYKEGKKAEKKFEYDSTDHEIETYLGRGQRKIKRKVDCDFTESVSPPPKLIRRDPIATIVETTAAATTKTLVNKNNGVINKHIALQEIPLGHKVQVQEFLVNRDDGALIEQCNTQGSYEDAKNKEKRLENESTNLENYNEGNQGRGKKKVKRKLYSNYIESTYSPPSELKILNTPRRNSDESNDGHDIHMEEYIVDSNGLLHQNGATNENFQSSVSPGTLSLHSDNGTTVTRSSDSQFSAIFTTLIEIKEFIKDLKIFLENFQINRPVGHSIQVNSVPNKAFNTYRKLCNYNIEIEGDENARKELEAVFYIQGGFTAKESIRRGLKRIFSNKLAKQCSWTGKGGNFPIQNLQILYLLKVAVRKRFADMTDNSFETEVKAWFRQAQLRYQREKDKKNKMNDNENK